MRGEVIGHPALEAVARKHDASAPQIALAWLREKGVTAVPKATGEAHIRDNYESLAVSLDEGDVAQIDDIGRTNREVNPDFAPESW